MTPKRNRRYEKLLLYCALGIILAYVLFFSGVVSPHKAVVPSLGSSGTESPEGLFVASPPAAVDSSPIRMIPDSVQVHVDFCNAACVRGSDGRNDFCFVKREVIFDAAQPEIIVSETCSELADSSRAYGFERCPNFC